MQAYITVLQNLVLPTNSDKLCFLEKLTIPVILHYSVQLCQIQNIIITVKEIFCSTETASIKLSHCDFLWPYNEYLFALIS